MKRLLNIGASHLEASSSAAKIATRAPSSELTFVDNSSGASAAAAELSAALGDALDQVDLSRSLDGQLREQIHQLDRNAATYSNATVDESACAEWACNQATSRTISAAWKCALSVYDPTGGSPSAPHCSFKLDHVVSPSTGGSTKALVTTIVTPIDANEFLPALIVAVRGSASRVDHMVNANSEPRCAFSFIGRGVYAHAGFLNCAEALDGTVSERIGLYTREHQSNPHIIFTGHSAGGAVAMLLFIRHLFNQTGSSTARLSCITFGSPPVLTQRLDLASSPRLQALGLCLNIINEFDVVSRMDRPYILSLANLLRSLHKQPTSANNTYSEESIDGSKPLGPRTSRPITEPSSQEIGHLRPGGVWAIAPALYHHVGALMVLRMRLDGDQLLLKTLEVPSDQFEQLLFCRVAVHSRACYSDRIRHLEGECQGH